MQLRPLLQTGSAVGHLCQYPEALCTAGALHCNPEVSIHATLALTQQAPSSALVHASMLLRRMSSACADQNFH